MEGKAELKDTKARSLWTRGDCHSEQRSMANKEHCFLYKTEAHSLNRKEHVQREKAASRAGLPDCVEDIVRRCLVFITGLFPRQPLGGEEGGRFRISLL